jgi:hypothetical protein
MNTPAHAVLGLLVLGRNESRLYIHAILLGSLLPDIPMFLFFLVERVVFDVPMRTIWTVSYYQPGWQGFFDIFNSIPLILVGAIVAARLQSKWWKLFFASMFLHVLFDLPLHNDDAHLHFYPFSNWRFSSPVSYWDPGHYGDIVAILEGVFGIVGCAFLIKAYTGKVARLSLSLITLFFLVHTIFVIIR